MLGSAPLDAVAAQAKVREAMKRTYDFPHGSCSALLFPASPITYFKRISTLHSEIPTRRLTSSYTTHQLNKMTLTYFYSIFAKVLADEKPFLLFNSSIIKLFHSYCFFFQAKSDLWCWGFRVWNTCRARVLITFIVLTISLFIYFFHFFYSSFWGASFYHSSGWSLKYIIFISRIN